MANDAGEPSFSSMTQPRGCTCGDGARIRVGLVTIAALLPLLAGCVAAGPCHSPEARPEDLRSVYVTRRGWHTGIMVARRDFHDREWALLADFPHSSQLEFGWGDERFYLAERNTPWLGSRAALWPTASVIHVIGHESAADRHVRADELIEVRIGARGLEALERAIKASFAHETPQPAGAPLDTAPAPNRFYEANGSFYFPRLCNWWVARKLEAAGCPIRSWSVLTAGNVIGKARKFHAAAAEPDS